MFLLNPRIFINFVHLYIKLTKHLIKVKKGWKSRYFLISQITIMESSIEVTTDKENSNGQAKGTTHVSGDKKLTKDTQVFLKRPVEKIPDPNRALSKAYGKKHFKESRFDHFRQLKKIRAAGVDSVSEYVASD